MSLLKLFGKNIFLLLFFVFAFGYGYSLVLGYEPYKYFLKPFIVPSLLILYLINSKEKSIFFIVALFFALLGDLLFSVATRNSFVYAMGSFLIFNLFIMMIVTEEAGEIRLNHLLLNMTPFLLLFFIIIYFLIENVGAMIILMSIYGVVLVVLCSFCLYYLIRTKSKIALYFFLGSMFFVSAGLTKVLKDYFGITAELRIMNNISYTFSLFFYYKAMITERVIIDDVELQNEKPLMY